MLVAIDTATRFASLALYTPNAILAECTWQTHDNHTVELMPKLARLMGRQGLDVSALTAVAVALGPGSYTGLRIGVAVAKGLAMSLGLPLVGIPTLDILPHAVGDVNLPTWSVIQAGRGRLCYAEYRYQKGAWKQQSDFEVGPLSALIARLEGFAVVCGELEAPEVGSIKASLGNAVLVKSPAFALRRAGYLAEMAWQRLEVTHPDSAEGLSPIYTFRPDGGT